MKTITWSVAACACALALAANAYTGGTKPGHVADGVARGPAAADAAAIPSKGTAPEVTLTLRSQPVSATVNQGDQYGAALRGTWSNAGSAPVYIQASDDSGTFLTQQPSQVHRPGAFTLPLLVPASKAPGIYVGNLTARACADPLCTQPYPGTTHSIGYRLKISAVGEWETLQRTSRHDGYVPVRIDAARYRLAWTWQRPVPGAVSPVVTQGENVYFAETGNSGSVYALRASDGLPQWRRVFGGSSAALNAPTVSQGVVYAATTGHEETFLYGLDATTGLQSFQTRFYTQWGRILNPTVRNGRAYVNAGYYGGVVYAFNNAGGTASWNASGGTYGSNTPAVDDSAVYVHNGSTLNVLDPANGTLSASIGPNALGVQEEYGGTPMIGSPDHVLAYSGLGYYTGTNSQRQLLDYSIASRAVRWMSISLYANFPAVARGVVYATSNESGTFDALDQATGRKLWSWKPAGPSVAFVGNVVVTDNVAFVSTTSRIYAIDLHRHDATWSAPTPGSISISPSRMLFVSSSIGNYDSSNGRITAYRLQ